MKKILLGVLGALVLVVLVVLVLAATQPDTIHLERSTTVAASPADVAPFAQDLKKVNEWSPWDERDPNLRRDYSEPTTGVGAWYAWEGNEEVGKGKQTIKVSEPGKVVHELRFIEPFPSVADASILWTADGEGTKVTWAFDQQADFPTKLMSVFMDWEEMLGPDFEKGLQLLTPLAEEAARARAASEQAAAKAAEEAAEEEAAGEAPE